MEIQKHKNVSPHFAQTHAIKIQVLKLQQRKLWTELMLPLHLFTSFAISCG